MALKGDANFKGKLTCGLRNGKKHLVNFHATSQNSENLHFEWFLFRWENTEELCKVWKKTDPWFQKWPVEFGEFSPNHPKVQKFHFDGLFLSKVYEVWGKKIQRSYLSWHWTVMQNLNKLRPCGFKNGMRNWENFDESTQSLKTCTLMGSFFQKHIMFQLENFRGIICHDIEGWCKI